MHQNVAAECELVNKKNKGDNKLTGNLLSSAAHDKKWCECQTTKLTGKSTYRHSKRCISQEKI